MLVKTPVQFRSAPYAVLAQEGRAGASKTPGCGFKSRVRREVFLSNPRRVSKMRYSRREKRKPKGFKPGSNKGGFQQFLKTLVKKCKDEGHAYFNFKDRRLKVIPITGSANRSMLCLIKDEKGTHIKMLFGNKNYFSRTDRGWELGSLISNRSHVLLEIVGIYGRRQNAE